MDRMSGEPKDRIGWGAVICPLVATPILVGLVYLASHPDLTDLKPFRPYIVPALIFALLLLSTYGWLTDDM